MVTRTMIVIMITCIEIAACRTAHLFIQRSPNYEACTPIIVHIIYDGLTEKLGIGDNIERPDGRSLTRQCLRWRKRELESRLPLSRQGGRRQQRHQQHRALH